MTHSCPVCKIPLTSKIYDGVVFTECSQCAGTWIYEEDLRRLEDENLQDLNSIDLMDVPMKPVESPAAALGCPVCAKPMDQFHFMVDNPIMLHRCDPCEGLWINHGEMTQMAAAIEVANRPPTAEEIALAQKARDDYNRGIPEKMPDSPARKSANESAVEVEFDREHAAEMAHYNAISSVSRLLNTRIWWRSLW